MVFGNIEDNGGWEAQGTSIVKVREFLHSINQQEYDSDGNEIYDEWNPGTVVIKEAHRLPQDPAKFHFIKDNDNQIQGPPRRRNRLLVARFVCYRDIGVIFRK